MSASADRSASSLITAAASAGASAAAALRSSNCSRQRCSDVFRLGPDFERPDFGELRAQLDRHQTLARFAESQHGVERSMQMQFALLLGEKT